MPGTSKNNDISSENNPDFDGNNEDGLFTMLDDLQRGLGINDTSPDASNDVDEIAMFKVFYLGVHCKVIAYKSLQSLEQ